jgi:putative membrane protein
MVLLVVTVALIVWLVNRNVPRRQPGSDSAEEVLRRRYASGEIDAEEYGRRLSVLRR